MFLLPPFSRLVDCQWLRWQYNETINDLLGTGELDRRKHGIKLDMSGRSTVTEIVTVRAASLHCCTPWLNSTQYHSQALAKSPRFSSMRSHAVR